MRLFYLLVLLLPALRAQVCVPAARLGANGTASGNIGETSCRMTDGTPYQEFPLLLPVRGQLQLDASAAFPLSMILRDDKGHALASGVSIRTPAEGGNYIVVATPANPGDAGPIEVTSGFTAEPGTFCRQMASIGLGIGLNREVGGRLTQGSCQLPDGTYYNAYTLTALGGGTLDISMQSGDFASYVILRGNDGYALAASDNGRLTYPLDAARTYTLAASAGDGGWGDYRLTLAFTPADGETCVAVRTLAPTDQDSGSITPDGCATPADPITGNQAFYNYYLLRVDAPGLAELRLHASGFDPTLELRDTSGATVAADSWSAGPGQAFIRRYLQPGDYTVLAFSPAAVAVDYSLECTFTPGSPAAVQVLSLDPGATATGTLSADSPATHEGPADIYRIVTLEPGTLEIGLGSPRFTPVVALRDARDNRIVADEQATGKIVADLPAGTYTIVAATADNPGDYDLSYNFTAHAPAACPDPPAMEAGYNGLLGPSSCRDANGQPVDWYTFTTPQDGASAFTMTSRYLFGSLAIANAAGDVLRHNERGLGGGDALIVQFLPAGTYRLAARGADGTPAGYYQVLRYFAPGSATGCKPVRSLAAGDDFDSQLNFTACDFPDGTFADIYRLDVNATANYTIQMDSPDIDSYLLVLDGKGNVVAGDDGVLTATLNPGTWYVAAKSSGGYTGGAYHLSVAADQ